MYLKMNGTSSKELYSSMSKELFVYGRLILGQTKLRHLTLGRRSVTGRFVNFYVQRSEVRSWSFDQFWVFRRDKFLNIH